MMTVNLPAIADKKPIVMELEPGTYYWCSCGLSSQGYFILNSVKSVLSPNPANLCA